MMLSGACAGMSLKASRWQNSEIFIRAASKANILLSPMMLLSPENFPPWVFGAQFLVMIRVWLTDSDSDQCRIESIGRSRFEATWSGDEYETWGNKFFTRWSGGVIE
jgi:hypothetical protein